MHRSAWVLFAFAWLAAGPAGPAFGQTLQVPSAPRHEEAVKPPSAAPRTPVHRAGPVPEHKVPVVEAHRSAHAHKPSAAAASGAAPKPAPTPVPTPAAPAQAPGAAAPTAAKPEKPAEKPTDAENAEATKLPRFASLRTDDVNMRAGPGTRYRIEWVYKRRDLPVEIERVFDVWRWVRDPDGIQGWVHQATLMGRRSFIIQKSDATLRAEPSDTAAPVATLKAGVIGRIRSCPATSAWCHVQAGSYRGYLRRDQFWGVLPGEAVNP